MVSLLFLVVFGVGAVVEGKCEETFKYTLSGAFTWEGNDTNRPSSAHFSPMVCSVSLSPVMFQEGMQSSPGFKSIAESGNPNTLLRELSENTEVMSNFELRGTSVGTSTGTIASSAQSVTAVGDTAIWLACVTMIAPSPDWVVGIPSRNLCDEFEGTSGGSFEVNLMAYDAGTKNGESYTGGSSSTDPQTPLAMRTEGVVNTYGWMRVTIESATPAPAPSPTPSECFPADAEVEVEDGSTKPMGKLSVGDYVKVANGLYSPVFMFTHKVTDGWFDFVQISTASGQVIRLTANHYIYVDGLLQAAGSVTPGARVQLGGGSSDRVVTVDRVKGEGLFNPQTLHGDIIVNNLRVSTYTTAIRPELAHMLLQPLRVLFRIGVKNPSLGLLNGGASRLAAILPSGTQKVVV